VDITVKLQKGKKKCII